MKTIKFKTNIKCDACVNTVKPQLDKLDDVGKWEVDLKNPDRILTVEARDADTSEKVMQALKDAGYAGQLQN